MLKGCITFSMIDPWFLRTSIILYKKMNMFISCWSFMYKLVDSAKCRLQTIVFRVRKQWDYPCWLEHRTGIARSRVQIPLKSWFIFSGFLRNCINCVHNCEDHSSFDFISAVLIYDLFHMHLSMGLLLSRSNLHGENNVLHREQSAFCTYWCYKLGHTLCHLIKLLLNSSKMGF